MRIVYTPIVADLFHYGHLRILNFAQSLGEYHICGVLTDEAVEAYRRRPLSDLKERKAIISCLECVDEVVIQNDVDPTENLKKIREKYKDAKLVVVYGSDWKHIPWAEFVEQIGGKIVQPPYYDRLSEFKIINRLVEGYKRDFRDFEDFTSTFKTTDFVEFDCEVVKRAIISTKANTLKALQPLLKHSKIEKTFVFTVMDRNEKEEEVALQIKKMFSPSPIVIRSSAINEDTFDSSMAGCFHSELNIPPADRNMVEAAIRKVVDSYKQKNLNSLFNQILVQKQTEDIKISGVVFTRTLERNAPYYVINYDDHTGLSDTVTKGVENKTVQILRWSEKKNWPKDLYGVLEAVQEIEKIVGDAVLDIEFAVNKKQEVVIFQVRPITLNTNMGGGKDERTKERIGTLQKKFVVLSKGNKTYFGDMPDWNPAEIIGNAPNYLDYSLYAYLIIDGIWCEARHTQGYVNVASRKLMVLFGNKPYVDIRVSFNSFMPEGTPKELQEKLISFYMGKLRQNPELQDKVEFEILHTCYDFSFDDRARELLEYGFTREEIGEYKGLLISLTNDLLKTPIEEDVVVTSEMETLREEVKEIMVDNENSPQELIKQAHRLLDDCKIHGTPQFSRLARLAFVGKIIFKSLVDKGVITEKFYHAFLNSIKTVATELISNFSLLKNGGMDIEGFLEIYGHLRSRTYDITSLRYDANPDLLRGGTVVAEVEKQEPVLPIEVKNKIAALFKEQKIDCDSTQLLEFIQLTLEAREFTKFEFTESLSDAIELIAKAGELLGFSREELSQLDLGSLFCAEDGDIEKTQKKWKRIIKQRIEERMQNEQIQLPPIIFSEKDFEIVSYYSAKPNFITQKSVEGPIVYLNNMNQDADLKGKIVLIESGDPGYDWIFTKNIAGIITKYGGVASHMAIRCAELGIPAAIGCGETTFNNLKTKSSVRLDCKFAKLECRDVVN